MAYFCAVDSRFTQQELPACKPILTPQWVVTTFIFIGIIFIPIGLAALSASEKVVEIIYRYDDVCVPTNNTQNDLVFHDRISFITDNKTNKSCIRTLTVPKKMKYPIYVYYQLDNFYQNHRRYVKSRNDEQLRDPNFNGDLKKTCAPEDMNGNEPVIPCGLIAWSLFNDTYRFSINDKPLPMNRRNISWPSDRKHKFGSEVYPKNFQKGSLIGGGTLDESIPMSEQEDLQIWMRTAALPLFRKLYGKLEFDLEANEKITVLRKPKLAARNEFER
ncbi:hypothetical protein K7X08_033890 [Anisodus acutangulus]|uniref:ALA-interacting subunit n=1 Tax=Anisodus acutangulus TaxID=402998 RepID=A0A9Q1M2X9_9SOLA|nr:hypothetical protein K7X08_033890 [Anisodus acutangulus]